MAKNAKELMQQHTTDAKDNVSYLEEFKKRIYTLQPQTKEDPKTKQKSLDVNALFKQIIELQKELVAKYYKDGQSDEWVLDYETLATIFHPYAKVGFNENARDAVINATTQVSESRVGARAQTRAGTTELGEVKKYIRGLAEKTGNIAQLTEIEGLKDHRSATPYVSRYNPDVVAGIKEAKGKSGLESLISSYMGAVN